MIMDDTTTFTLRAGEAAAVALTVYQEWQRSQQLFKTTSSSFEDYCLDTMKKASIGRIESSIIHKRNTQQ